MFKFFAVLRDSLREAIDTKVLYVMVGLSVLVGIFTGTMTFTPKEHGQEFMKMASVGLIIESSDEIDPENPQRFLMKLMGAQGKLFEVKVANPLNGAPDAPSSRFRVQLRQLLTDADKAKSIRDNPQESYEKLTSRFGAIDDMRLLKVDSVKLIERPAEIPAQTEHEVWFELETSPTAVTRRLWPHIWGMFGGNWQPSREGTPLGMQMFLIEQVIVGWIGASITLLVSVIITAFFIPNMLRKGTVDMLIVKPMWRGTLLIYKFIGGLTFMFVNTFVAVFIIWFALGLKSGIWATAIFWMVPVLTFSFAVLYAVSTLFAVLTRSAIVAILMTAFAWMALWVVSVMHQFVEAERMREEREKVVASQAVSQSLFGQIVYAVHYVLPRRGDLDSLTTRLLFEDLLTANQIKLGKFDKAKISWQESVTVSCIHIAWMLAVSCWWFSVKDY